MKPMPTFDSPISDLELWRRAQTQIDQHAGNAMNFAGKKMADMDSAKDLPEFGACMGIAVRIARLERTASPGPLNKS